MQGIFLFRESALNHWIVTAKIWLSLWRNMAQTNTTIHYDWSLLNTSDIKDEYTLTWRNKFDALQEISETPSLNNKYENFVNAHLEAATECIPTKQRAKCRVPWETLVVRKKHANIKTAFLCNKRNPTNINAQAQNDLTNVYLKEQTEYIQNQIKKIRDSLEDRQSRKAWQTVKEVSRRKSTARAKVKAVSQEERIHLGKQHFKNLLGKPPKVTDEPITKIISNQIDIKLGQFMQELDSVQRKILNRKAAGLDEIHLEVWKTREFNNILLQYCNAVYNQNTIDRWTKGCIFLFPKKGDLRITKNYQGITLTSIAAKMYATA